MTSIQDIRAVPGNACRDPGEIRRHRDRRLWVVCPGRGNFQSDIDIIVELGRPIGWELVDLSDYLESRLHHKVDLVIKRSLHPLIRDAILAEVQYA